MNKKSLKTILILFTLFLTSCSKKELIEENLITYETHWNTILNTSSFLSNSNNFDIEAELFKTDNVYEYVIVVDNPQTAMYEVEIVVIEDKKNYSSMEEMLPSAGIFENSFNLIPNQVRNDKGFKEGAALVRQNYKEDTVNLQVLVAWKNYTRLESFREVFEFTVGLDSPVKVKELELEDEVFDEDQEEIEVEETETEENDEE